MEERQITAAEESADKTAQARLEVYDWVQCIVTALVAGILCFMFVLRVVGVVGSSMYPTLRNGDRVLTSKLFYTPKQGDIVVVQTETFGDEPLVKRVVATGGQRVDIDFSAGVVYVDGVALDEPYVNAPVRVREDFTGEVTVPEGCVFLMGDNRNASTDSRSRLVGFVDERCVIGKVLWILAPGKGESTYPGRDGAVAMDFSRIGNPYKLK